MRRRSSRVTIARVSPAALFAARLADVVSTRLATPKLRLEANPVVRKLGWPFAWATLGVCVLPYVAEWGWAPALAITVTSLQVSASNFSRLPFSRTLGEEAYAELLERVHARAPRRLIYGCIAASSALITSAGALLLLFYPNPAEPAYYFAVGMIGYGLAIAVHFSLNARRMFQRRSQSSTRPSSVTSQPTPRARSSAP